MSGWLLCRTGSRLPPLLPGRGWLFCRSRAPATNAQKPSLRGRSSHRDSAPLYLDGFAVLVNARHVKAGIFLWARHPALPDSTELAYKAAEQDILPGPGHLFGAELRASAWLRFNVIFCDEPGCMRFCKASARRSADRATKILVESTNSQVSHASRRTF